MPASKTDHYPVPGSRSGAHADQALSQWVQELLPDQAQPWMHAHPLTTQLIGLCALAVLCTAALYLGRGLLKVTVIRVIRGTDVRWDDILVDTDVFRRVTWLIPTVLAYIGVQVIPKLAPKAEMVVMRLAMVGAALAFSSTLGALITALNEMYQERDISRSHPIKGYLQIARVVLYIVTTIVVVSILFDKSPTFLLSGLGAMTAVLMLVFKDTITNLLRA